MDISSVRPYANWCCRNDSTGAQNDWMVEGETGLSLHCTFNVTIMKYWYLAGNNIILLYYHAFLFSSKSNKVDATFRSFVVFLKNINAFTKFRGDPSSRYWDICLKTWNWQALKQIWVGKTDIRSCCKRTKSSALNLNQHSTYRKIYN